MAISRGLATTGDVQEVLYFREFLENDLNSGHPDVADVEGAIDREIDFIYMRLKTAGYTVPFVEGDEPYAYRFTKELNAIAAALAIERRWGESDHYSRLNDYYIRLMDEVMNRDILLTDATGVPTLADLAKSGTSELAEDGDERVPFFTREDEF